MKRHFTRKLVIFVWIPCYIVVYFTLKGAMFDAVERNDVNKLRWMFWMPAIVWMRNWYGYTPLHEAAYSDSPEVIAKLLDLGAYVNLRGRDNDTPLMIAASKGAENNVRILLDAGADTDMRSIRGFTALQYATGENIGIMQLLLSAGADPNIQSKYGWVPLHVAMNVKDDQITELLLEAGADPNVQAYEGQTPLHLAVQYGELRKVARLLDAGADAGIADHEGVTPLGLIGRDSPLYKSGIWHRLRDAQFESLNTPPLENWRWHDAN